MKKYNKILFGIDLFFLIIILSALSWNSFSKRIGTTCIKTVNTLLQGSSTQESLTIGLSLFNRNLEYFQRIEDGVLAKSDELGIEVILHDQKSSTIEMTMGVGELLEQNIDALLISPYSPEVMSDIVAQAKGKGIPVIVVDVGAGDSDVNAVIRSDSFGGGVLAGEYALRLIHKYDITSKNAAVIKVIQTNEPARERGEAFENVMEDYGYQIVSTIEGESDKETAYQEVKVLLETYPDDLAVIFAENDDMALGAAQAVEEAGKKGEIMIIGFNGDPSAIEAIRNGSIQGTIAQQPRYMGELGVELVNSLLHGGHITYDDTHEKELYTEIFLIDETGTPQRH